MSHGHEQDEGPRKRRFGDLETSYDTVIGRQVTVTGEVRGSSSVDFHGKLEGNLEIEGFLRIRDGARIVGDITATNVIVEGEVLGNVRALEKVELRSASRVEGDLVAESVAIAEGGQFDGKITMAGSAEPRQHVSFKEKRSIPE